MLSYWCRLGFWTRVLCLKSHEHENISAWQCENAVYYMHWTGALKCYKVIELIVDRWALSTLNGRHQGDVERTYLSLLQMAVDNSDSSGTTEVSSSDGVTANANISLLCSQPRHIFSHWRCSCVINCRLHCTRLRFEMWGPRLDVLEIFAKRQLAYST